MSPPCALIPWLCAHCVPTAPAPGSHDVAVAMRVSDLEDLDHLLPFVVRSGSSRPNADPTTPTSPSRSPPHVLGAAVCLVGVGLIMHGSRGS